jgi:hypothetical protein
MYLRESNAERFERIRHTVMEGHSISNADAKWLIMQFMAASDLNKKLRKEIEQLTPVPVEGGPMGEG